MAYVCGNSEEARKLADVLKMTMQRIDEETAELDNGAKQVLSGWNDEDASEIEEMSQTIKSKLSESVESAGNVEKSLEDYAEFLERH